MHILSPSEFNFSSHFLFPVREEDVCRHRYPGTVIGGSLSCPRKLKGIGSFLRVTVALYDGASTYGQIVKGASEVPEGSGEPVC